VLSEFQKIHAAAKRPVDIWTNYGYYFFSLRFVYLIRKTSITPNQVTIFSFILLLVAAWFFSLGTREAILIGLLIHQVSFVLDCADGQLARYKRQFSPYGAWLDQIADRIKEYVIALSLAFGYARFHTGNSVWEVALTCLFLLYLLEYYEQQRGKIGGGSGKAGATDAMQTEDAPKQGNRLATLARWRRAIPFRGFTIGEQYFLTGVLLLLTNPYVTLLVVTYVALVMAIYHPVVTFLKQGRAVR